MEQLEILPQLEAEDLSKFFPIMLSRAFLECYISGLFFFVWHLISVCYGEAVGYY